MVLEDVDASYIELIMKWFHGKDLNETVDFSKPYIKDSLKYVYPLFIFLHACVVLFGTFGNIAILVVIMKTHLYDNPTFFFIGNLALSDIIKAAFVLPITVVNLLIQNWIFGSFLCYVLPMMHFFPIHASMLTYIMLAVDRYRFIVLPMKSRVPAGLCTIAVWVIAVCVVLPYAVYIKYIDLGALVGQALEKTLDGAGICWFNTEQHIEGYIRAIFVTMYCLPLAVITFLYIKVSAELKHNDPPSVSVQIDELTNSLSSGSYHSRLTWMNGETSDQNSSTRQSNLTGRNRHPSTTEDDEIDIRKEKRTQKYMISMVTLFAMCWCPINILILVTHFVFESEDNIGHFDITYLTITFFGFLSTCINPVLFASWHMSESTKDRLRGYFRFSNRRRESAHSVLTQRSPQASEIYSQRNSPSPNPSSNIENGRLMCYKTNQRSATNTSSKPFSDLSLDDRIIERQTRSREYGNKHDDERLEQPSSML